jgi:hypothetical protein
MKKLSINIGRADKYVRVILMVVLLFLYNYFGSDLFLLVAIVLGVTVTLAWCPLYFIIGYRTCRKPENN